MVKKTTYKTNEKNTVKPIPKMTYYQAVGRRKEASARVRLYMTSNEEPIQVGNNSYTKGQIIVNDRLIEKYFPGEVAKKIYMEPLRTSNNIGRFIITVKVEGGGLNGQLKAVVHGLARAMEKIDRERYRPIFKKHGFMTRDPRAKQRRKAGFAHKARKKKQSPKR